MPKAQHNRTHVWILGASRGIGLAIAETLCKTCNLTLTARNEAALTQIQTLLSSEHIQSIACDIADESSMAKCYSQAISTFGTVDILINSAGVGIWKDVIDMSVVEFVDQHKINLTGGFVAVKTVLPSMINDRRGMIITINSISALTAYVGNAGYGSSKAGLLTMNRVLRNEVREYGIKVTDIILGATSTEMWKAALRDEFGSRMMVAADVAGVVAYLISHLDNPRTHIEEIVIRPQEGDF